MVPGAVVANVANLLPPVLFVLAASLIYMRYAGTPAVQGALLMVRYTVVALIAAIAIKLLDTSHLLDVKVLPVLIIAFLLMTLTKVHPAIVIIGASLYGGFMH
jgi:chromate transporter